MFFWVKKEEGEKCPYCSVEIKGNYQSKSSIGDLHDEWGGCCEEHPDPLPMLKKEEVENFYTTCQNCHKWIEYKTQPLEFILIDNQKE